MSTVKVNTVDKRTGSTLTLGGCGTTVTLGAGATQSGFGRTGTVDWCTTAKTAPFTGVSGKGYFVNTTCGAVTVTLPATPSAGDIISIADYASTWNTNNLTLCNNGSKINGTCATAKLSTKGQSITLVYVDETKGWKNTMDSTSDITGGTYITATGGTVITCGDYKTHIFTSSGTFCVSAGAGPFAQADYLVVAGGGGGSGFYYSGGGGAGGFRTSNGLSLPAASPLASGTGVTVSVQSYPITVGGGGSGGACGSTSPTAGGSGSSSSFSTITSTGGGGGGNEDNPATPGGSGGGSGGYAPTPTAPLKGIGGTGNSPPVSPPQGQAGGSTLACSPTTVPYGAGGGGAGEVGNPSRPGPGVGGIGSYIADAFIGPTAPSYGEAGPIGSTRYFAAGGGGGGGNAQPSGPVTAGGIGGGGDGYGPATGVGSAGNATTNTGSGGGGVGNNSPYSNGLTGGSGGSGIVMIRYKYQ